MKVLSWNVNGLRSVYKKGFLKWFEAVNADIVCFQEIKIQKKQLTTELLKPGDYHSFFNFAKKSGYAGVAVYSKKKPLSVKYPLKIRRFNNEGRVLELEYPGLTLINLYMPHGGRKKENLIYKLRVYGRLVGYLKKIKNRKVILIGDFNIAHKEIDLARPKENKDNIMFTAEERKQIDRIIGLGFIDSFRVFHKESGQYTWLSYFRNAREKNLGWRIDYVFVSQLLKSQLKKAYILKETKGSDHCPMGVELK